MQQVISTQKTQAHGHSYAPGALVAGLISKFMAWCNTQERNRFLWVAISFVGGIAAVLPVTLMAIILGADNNPNLWIAACVVNVPILVVNLAAQPAKVILPVLFIGWAVDAMILIYCLAYFFMK